ncbi:MAG TPA: Gfo/Idh/MocA family oxidoreductase [Acidobacteriota bacterium]|nr:Gfo/Idh/MocA family oxidoreductase [Acidobacteriota bacterium]
MNRREFMKRSTAMGVSAGMMSSVRSSRVPPSDRITVGIIGSGARAQQLMDAMALMPDVEMVAVSDAYQGRAERARARTGGRAKIVKDYKEILADSQVDTVLIGTPDHWHKTMVVESVEAGKDVYCEKPLTYSVDEGLEIVDAVKRTNRILQVGSQGMSSPTQEQARKIVQEGKLGKVTMIRASYNRNTASGAWIYPIPPDASEKTIDWQAFLGPAPDHPFSRERFFRWRCYWDYSGGISTDLFVHLVTTIHFVMNATMPKTVIGSGELYRWTESRDVPDTVNAILIYPENFTVNLSSTFNNQSSSESGFEILGTEGSLVFRGGEIRYLPENNYEDNRWVVRSWPEELEKAYYNDPQVQQQESPWTWEPQVKTSLNSWEEWGQDATFIHARRFFDAVRSRKQPVQDARFGHHAASCAHMINMSIRDGGRPVEWDFNRDNVKA